MAKEEKGKKGGIGVGSWICLGLLVPVGVLTFNCGRNWNVVRAKKSKLDAEVAALLERNRQLAPFYEVLQNRKYQICNRSQDVVKVKWMAATYNESEKVKLFDSSRCQDWRPVMIQPGENKFVTLSSGQEGCNWNGNVMYFSIAYDKESPEQTTFYETIDVFRGFDRDCHNIP